MKTVFRTAAAVSALLLLAGGPALAQSGTAPAAANVYQQPPAPIADILDARPLPTANRSSTPNGLRRCRRTPS